MIHREEGWLREKYYEEGLTQPQMANKADVSVSTISSWMDRHGIEVEQYERLKKEPPEDIEELVERYRNEKPLLEIANGRDFSHPTLQRWLKEAGVNIREQYPEGEDNPLWNGGYEPDKEEQKFYSSTEWKRTRETVLERDGYECTQCGTEESLDVHHLRPIKMGGNKTNMNNLITVCRRCHNFWHEKVYFD